MNRLGKYCKAYTLDELRKFSGWNEELPEKQGAGANGEAQAEGEADLSDIVFLQEDYTVTTGIFLDENVVFDKVTPEWIEFCRDTLKFDVPAIEPSNGNAGQASSMSG
ncbi:MAG TPA: hypothetical protein VF543_05690 [Pyrinomonadaceae bacterium]|jgi:hypothetical protein